MKLKLVFFCDSKVCRGCKCVNADMPDCTCLRDVVLKWPNRVSTERSCCNGGIFRITQCRTE